MLELFHSKNYSNQNFNTNIQKCDIVSLFLTPELIHPRKNIRVFSLKQIPLV